MPIKALHQFPRGFLWGCATAAHQVEGQNVNDWWRWEQTPGHIFQNQKSGDACQWWKGRYLEDFDRAAEMNNNAQRLSIEWSRIEPEPGKWDTYALERYRDMLNALHERGMRPMVTLHHFTNPLWIDDHKGWLWDEMPQHFARFAHKVVEALGDLCTLWCTINEPLVYATQGFSFGKWPPGIKDRNAVQRVTINMLRGHAAAYRAIKDIQPESEVGFAAHFISFKPHTPAFVHSGAVWLVNRAFNHAFILAIRDGVVRVPGSRAVAVPEAKNSVDWIGLQYYQQYHVGFSPFAPASFFIRERKPNGVPVGPGNWGGLAPEAIYDHIRWLWTTLQKPIYVTESGVPDPDDTIRPAYLSKTVRAVWKAVNFNFPVRGFFFWSLVDNFEWSEGYDPRFSFGLYKTNFQTQERTPRQSARLYRDICGQNGLSAQSVNRFAPDALSELFPGEAGQDNVKLKPHGRG
jgi:beta-glucosidase